MSSLVNSRVRRLALLAGSAAGLALLIFLFAALQARTPGEPQASEQSRLLSTQAGEALRSGDETLAATLAERALRLDTRNSAATGIAEQVAKRRSTRAAGGGSEEGDQSDAQSPEPGQPADSGDLAFAGPIEGLETLLPQTFDGYVFGAPVALEGEASISASASRRAGPTRILWAIHDAGKERSAKEFLNSTSRRLYGSDSGDVEIDGADAYFGTDGMRFATVVYRRGRYVFEVLVSGTDDAPVRYRDVAVSAAKAFGEDPRR